MKRTIKGMVLLVFLVFLTACSVNNDNAATGGAVSAKSYTGKANGYGGEITVTIEVSNGIITNSIVIGDKETPSVGGAHLEGFQKSIVENNGKVDTISGATVTSNGVIAALQKAMQEAGLLESKIFKMKPGTYEGSAHGFSSIDFVTVNVTVSEDKIESTELVDNFLDDADSYENRYLCTGAFEILNKQIIDAQSIGIDVVTGATGSSSGIKNAVRDALKQAFIASGCLENEVDLAINNMFMSASTKVNDVVELHYDVVVVGAGAAGATASIAALDTGAQVLNIEKTFSWGGQSMLTGGPKAYSPDTTEEESQAILENYEKHIDANRFGEDKKWNEESYRISHANEFLAVNKEAYKAVIPASGEGVKRIIEYGMHFTLTGRGPVGADLSELGLENAGHDPVEGLPSAINSTSEDPIKADDVYTFGTNGEGTSIYYSTAELYYEEVFNNYVKKGGNYLLQTTAKELIYKDNDKKEIIGIKAESDNGTIYEIYADAIVLATGGFGGSKELTEKWTAGGGDWLYYGYQNNTGDGILMALDAGGKGSNLDAYPMSHQRMGAQFITAFEPAMTEEGKQWSPNDLAIILAVNPDGVYLKKNGENFISEEHGVMGFSASMGTYHLGSSYYVVYSSEQLEEYSKNGIEDTTMGFQNTGMGVPKNYPLGDWLHKVLDQASKQGFAWKVDSLEDADELLGLEKGTFSNAYKVDGKGKNNSTSEYYYVMKCTGLSISSCGGVLVSSDMQVVREDGSIIDNLFIAGNDGFGNIMATGAEYPIGGDAGMWVFGSGNIAGENAAKFAIK